MRFEGRETADYCDTPTLPDVMRERSVVWYARGGGVKKCGPFRTQIDAVNSMRLATDRNAFPADVFVWPEIVELLN